MNILIISKDLEIMNVHPTLSESRLRHHKYISLSKYYYDSDVKIFAPRSHNQNKETLNYDVNSSFIQARSSWKLLFAWETLYLILALHFSGWRIDLITTQDPFMPALTSLLAAKLIGAKLVPQVHLSLFSKAWRNENKLINTFRYFLSRVVLQNSYKIRMVSPVTAEVLTNRFSISPSSISVIPVPINIGNYIHHQHYSISDSILHLSVSKKIIVFIGRLVKAKNLNLWIETAEKIYNSEPFTHFLIIGQGPENDIIKDDVKNKKMDDNFTFLGEIHNNLVPYYLNLSSLFLLTSSNESYGRVIIEAFASRVPVISTHCDGPQSLIKDGITGFLCEHDSTILAKRCLEVLQSSQLSDRLTENAFLTYKRDHSPEIITKKIVDFWHKA